jgi:type I restriction enzyme, S subunit
MSDSVPAGWDFKTIEKCCEILDSKRIPINSQERAKRKGIYPYYGANGVQGYIDDYIFDEETILLAEDGGNFEQFAERPIAYMVSGKYWVNNHAHIIKAKGEHTNHFIFYSIVHKNIVKHINGGTRSKLNQSDLREIPILIPPLPEQQKIASILTSVDTVIEKTEAQINKLKDLKKAMMQELLTKGIGHTEFKDSSVGRIPKGWEVKRLGEVAINVIKKTIPNSNAIKKYVGLEHILPEANQIVMTGSTSDVKSTKTEFNNGDTLFGKLRPYLRKVALVGFSGVCSTDILAIRPQSSIASRFLFCILTTERTISLAIESSAGNIMPRTSWGDLSELLIPVPPKNEQDKISSIILSVEKSIKSKQNKLSHTKSLKKALMQDLLTGKVRVAI